MLDEKGSWKDFFVSKAFASIVTILITYFFSEDASRIAGYGISFAQEIATGGVLGSVALMLWSNYGRVKRKVQLRKDIAAARLDARQAEGQVDDLKEAVRSKNKEVEVLESRFPAKGPDGKFTKRPRSKPK